MNYFINEDKSIRLYNEDCLIILDNLIQNKKMVDLIVCDPAYKVTPRGCSGTTGGMMKKNINMKGIVFEYNAIKPKDWFEKAYEVLKESGHCYIMTNHANLSEFLNIAKEVGFEFIKSLIWKKDNKIMGRFYMSQFEYILFFRKGKAVKINNCGTSDIIEIPNRKQKDENGKNLHDTEKPVELMKVLIENSSQENDIVLDFMAGIGATGVACKELKRNFIGIEIDKTYYDIMIDRIFKEEQK